MALANELNKLAGRPLVPSAVDELWPAGGCWRDSGLFINWKRRLASGSKSSPHVTSGWPAGRPANHLEWSIKFSLNGDIRLLFRGSFAIAQMEASSSGLHLLHLLLLLLLVGWAAPAPAFQFGFEVGESC